MKRFYVKRIGHFFSPALFAFVFSLFSPFISSNAAGAGADIKVEMDLMPGSHYSNQAVFLKIYVTNNGPLDASGITVHNILPGNMVIDSYYNSKGTYDTTTHNWALGTMLNGEEDTMRIKAYPKSTGTYNAKAYKSTENEYDSFLSNDTSRLKFSIYPSSDLVIIAATRNGVFVQNSIVTMNVFALNEGPDDATGVKVFNHLPSSLTYYSDSLSRGTYDTLTGVWTIGNMGQSSFATMKLEVRINTGDSATNAELTHLTYLGASPSTNSNFINNFNVPAFQDTLGTLTSIHFNRNATFSNTVKIENMDPNHICTYSCKANGVFKLTGIHGLNFKMNSNPLTDTVTVGKYDGTMDYQGNSGETFGMKNTSSSNTFTLDSNLTYYHGASPAIVNFIDSLDSTYHINILHSSLVNQSISTLVQSTITVDYYYRPNASPYNVSNPFTIGGDQFDPDVTNNTAIAPISSLNPLPVELLTFQAVPANDKVQVRWTTATEVNNNHFEIERSAGAGNPQFEKLGEVQGNGNSETLSNYNFLDLAPLPGTSYYRLKQVDNNGSFSYSKIVEVSFDQNAKAAHPALTIYPNPLTEGSKAVLALTDFPEGVASLSVIDITGRLVYHEDIAIKNDIPVTEEVAYLNKLQSGLYTILINEDGNSFAGKWVINK